MGQTILVRGLLDGSDVGCEIEFGTGLPLRVQQAMLPDMIKIWQSRSNGPVEIIFSGYAAKTMSGA